MRAVRPVETVLWLCLAGLAARLGFQRIRSFDYWWHLRTGGWIREHGRVPDADPYSFTAAGAPWLDVHWAYQLGLDALHRLAGHDAVVLTKGVLALAVFGLLAWVAGRWTRPGLAVLLFAPALLVLGERFMARPELLSFVFLAAILALLERHAEVGRARRAVFAVVPTVWLWANVHGLYAIGIALVAMYLVPELMRPLLRRDESLQRGVVARLGLVLTGSVGAGALTPGGVETLRYPWIQLGMIGAERDALGVGIRELQPTLVAGGGQLPLLTLITGFLCLAAVLALLLNARRLQPAHPLLLLAFLYLGLAAVRNLALLALVAALIAGVNWNALRDRHPGPRALRWGLRSAAAIALALLWSLELSGSLARHLGSDRQPGFGLQDGLFAEGAFAWIERERPPGPIAHSLPDGGLLIAKLWPDYRALIDGRLEVYGAARFAELVISDPERFLALDERYAFGVHVVHYSLFAQERLVYWMQQSRFWRLVYVDDVAAVWVRDAGEATPWPALDLDAASLLPPLDDPPGFRDRVRRRGRTRWWMSLRRYERALAEWDALLARYPREPDGATTRAFLAEAAAGR